MNFHRRNRVVQDRKPLFNNRACGFENYSARSQNDRRNCRASFCPVITMIVVAIQLALGAGVSVDAATGPAIYHEHWIDLNKSGAKDIYEDASAEISARIDDLLGRMTLEEKTAQMATLYGYPRVLKDEFPDIAKWKTSLWKDGIGNIDEHANGNTNYGEGIEDPKSDLPFAAHAGTINEVQRFFVEETRLGIPADFTNEGVRGLLHSHATTFPSPLGIAAAWDVDLVRQIGRIVGTEARALGYTNVYAPILDLPRDPRWGRCSECYSEDPYLTAECGVAMCQSMQAAGVGSTLKHFAVYGTPSGGRDGGARTDPMVTWLDVQSLHLVPFREVIRRAHPQGVMASYNDYNGEPIEGSRRFLTDILRNEYGFSGYVVSDSGAVRDLHHKHRVAVSRKEAVFQAVMAGLNVRTDFTMPDVFVTPLRELVREGRIPMMTLDSRVRDILRVKFELGLFDHPYVENPETAVQVVHSPEHMKVAERAARESIVLLKNDGHALPLSKSIKRVLVTGPLADNNDAWRDRYGPQRVDFVTPLEGIRRKLGDACEVRYVKGCDVVDARYPASDVYREPPSPAVRKAIDEAVAAAKGVDVVIAVLGEDGNISREDRSRISLDLPGNQGDLLRALHATGRPLVLVLSSGRPLSIAWADDHVPAILEMWFSNEPGGDALADILFGDVNPSARLPVTFPRSVGQIPMAFPVRPGAQAHDGGQVQGPLYAFGFGLSYTTFKYSDLTIIPTHVTASGNLRVACKVSNTGDRAGDEIVQLYLRDDYSSVTTFEKSLRGFRRLSLQPGETRSVEFTLTPKDLQLYSVDQTWVVEPGTFTVWIGAALNDLRLKGTFEVTGESPQLVAPGD